MLSTPDSTWSHPPFRFMLTCVVPMTSHHILKVETRERLRNDDSYAGTGGSPMARTPSADVAETFQVTLDDARSLLQEGIVASPTQTRTTRTPFDDDDDDVPLLGGVQARQGQQAPSYASQTATQARPLGANGGNGEALCCEYRYYRTGFCCSWEPDYSYEDMLKTSSPFGVRDAMFICSLVFPFVFARGHLMVGDASLLPREHPISAISISYTTFEFILLTITVRKSCTTSFVYCRSSRMH